MKIVHLAKNYLPHLGGVEIHLKEINSLLVKMGHEVVVVTEQHDRKLSDTANYEGVKVIRIPKGFSEKKRETWDFIKSQSEIFEDADIVHVHDVFWWILPVYRSVKKKIYITFHGWETHFPVPFNAKFQRYLYSKMAKGSIHVGGWIQDFYFDKPDFVTYGAINPKRLTKSGMGNSHNSDQELNLAFVGRLSEDNDLKKYIKLVKLLKTRTKKVNMTWVGDGDFREKCEQVGKVTGYVKNVSKHLVDKDFVFSSSYLSILEAQLLENNVCAFYSNDLKKAYLEKFPGSKYMLISNDVDSMLKKINLSLKSPILQKKTGKEASEFAKSQTWKKVLDLYLQLWGVEK